MRHYARNAGFTLIELSIVIVIIALITAGITSGASFMNDARLKVIVKELHEHEVAIELFQEKFNYPPGDFPNATKYWSGTGNGDGDFYTESGSCTGSIVTSGAKEDVKAWKHLELAGLTDGKTYTGDCSSDNELVLGVNTPQSHSIKNGGYWYVVTAAAYYSRPTEMIIQFGSLSASGTSLSGSVLNTEDAKYIDDKMDDGMADSGALFVSNGEGTSSCTSAEETAASGNFNLANKQTSCVLFYYPGRY